MIQREIQESAFRAQRAIETGESTVVGVTRFQTGAGTAIPTFTIDPEYRARPAAARARGPRLAGRRRMAGIARRNPRRGRG